MNQHYIFPTEGVTQEGDEQLCHDMKGWPFWSVVSAGIPITDRMFIRRPVPSGEWVSVKERMPTKEDGPFVWCGRAGEIDQIGKGYWDSLPLHVTHWMTPIPIPRPIAEDPFEDWWNDQTNDTLATKPKEVARQSWNAALAAGKEGA